MNNVFQSVQTFVLTVDGHRLYLRHMVGDRYQVGPHDPQLPIRLKDPRLNRKDMAHVRLKGTIDTKHAFAKGKGQLVRRDGMV